MAAISLPTEDVSKFLGYLGSKDLTSCAQVCRVWRAVADTLFPQSLAFRKEAWQSYLKGDVEEEPPFPEGLARVLKEPCPFTPDRRRWHTHKLVLIPSRVNNEPYDAMSLCRRAHNSPRDCGYKWYEILQSAQRDTTVAQSYWVLMPKEAISGEIPEDYRLAHLIERVTVLFAHYKMTFVRLSADEKVGRCEEADGFAMQVGKFIPEQEAFVRDEDTSPGISIEAADPSSTIPSCVVYRFPSA